MTPHAYRLEEQTFRTNMATSEKSNLRCNSKPLEKASLIMQVLLL